MTDIISEEADYKSSANNIKSNDIWSNDLRSISDLNEDVVLPEDLMGKIGGVDDEDEDGDQCSLIEMDAPDGGWGWAVVFASFMVHVLADGVTYSFGALTTEFISHFGASREDVGWMASILVGMTLTAGPLASILCNRYGFRAVTIAGSLISSVGFCAPFFYPKFWFIYLSASIFTGIGFGLVYLPSIVTVSIYFQKKRAFAIGLAVCGSGIGTFIFSPLIEYFNAEYGWQGTMLLVGGLILNCFACGAVYRPLKTPVVGIMSCHSSRSSCNMIGKISPDPVAPIKKTVCNGPSTHSPALAEATSGTDPGIEMTNNNSSSNNNFDQLLHSAFLSTTTMMNRTSRTRHNSHTHSNHYHQCKSSNTQLYHFSHHPAPLFQHPLQQLHQIQYQNQNHHHHHHHNHQHHNHYSKNSSRPDSRCIMSAPDIQQMLTPSHQASENIHGSGSRRFALMKMSYPHLIISSQINLHVVSHRPRDRHNSSSNTPSNNILLSKVSTSSQNQLSQLNNLPNNVKTDKPNIEVCSLSCPSEAESKGCAKENFDITLFKNPIFLLFAFSNFFTSIGFNAPFLYAKDRALQMGMSNGKASFLISSIGIGNTLGRVLFGYLSTKNFINRLQLYNGSLMISGFVVIFSSFAITYPWMIAYTVAFGILTGTYVTLTSVVLVDLLGIEKLNASFGMTMVFQGAAVFIGPPLAGWIFDVMNSFDWSFWVCGGFLALSGAMLYLVYCSADYRKKEKFLN